MIVTAPSPTTLRVACVQTTASADMEANLAALPPLLAAAQAKGAQLIALPENVSCMVAKDAERLAGAYPAANHPALPFFAQQAKQLEVWLLCGSLWIAREDGKIFNRSYLFAPDGSIAAHYDKIHLFDATLSSGEHYRESERVAPGDRAVLVPTPFGQLGLTICYDVRFGKLYRELAMAGASLIAVPAAFTVPTGEAHWHSLLRARAIETGCFIIAPAQCGTHAGGRRTFGHSLIIDPWGTILAEADDAPTIIYADLALAEPNRVRQMLPSLQHERPYALPPDLKDH
jgi:deaminated glutathione amidase